MGAVDRFALRFDETLEMNRWEELSPHERASCIGDFEREHVEVCTAVNRRIAFLASQAGRPFPIQETA